MGAAARLRFLLPAGSLMIHSSGALCMESGTIKEPFVMLLQLLEQLWVQIIGYVQILELWMPMKCWLNMRICCLTLLLHPGSKHIME